MKQGHRPIVLGGVVLVPEHPTWWEVPEKDREAIDHLVETRQVEYEQHLERAANGHFAPPELQLETVRRGPGRPRK